MGHDRWRLWKALCRPENCLKFFLPVVKKKQSSGFRINNEIFNEYEKEEDEVPGKISDGNGVFFVGQVLL
jgi:hypothetical protein